MTSICLDGNVFGALSAVRYMKITISLKKLYQIAYSPIFFSCDVISFDTLNAIREKNQIVNPPKPINLDFLSAKSLLTLRRCDYKFDEALKLVSATTF